MSTTLETPISSIEKKNTRRVNALKSLGVVSVGDALTYYPFRITEPVPPKALQEARIGERMAFAAHVREVRVFPMARRGYRLVATVDDSGFAASRRMAGSFASLVFFSYKKSYVDWVQRRLHVDALLVVCGEPSVYGDLLQFTHPDLLTVDPAGTQSDEPEATAQRYDARTVEDALTRVCRPRPVYHANSRISSERIHESILRYMDELRGEAVPVQQDQSTQQDQPVQQDRTAQLQALMVAVPDIIPEDLRQKYGWMHRAEAFMAIHDPENKSKFNLALETLRYEEALVCQTALVKSRDSSHKASAKACADTSLKNDFIASLPFSLTGGQQDVIEDISADMARDYPMQRLLQGEVGSGKTVVAVAAMMQAVGSGGQAVLVAPTQVLAEQHYESIRAMVARMEHSDDAGQDESSTRIPVLLLTGGMKLAVRRRVLATAASGVPCIVVATHAAFSKTFQAPNLTLAVIDEQHRFGVEQRESLNSKASNAPHLLVMTATPIPRTAAMTWFGDLDISWLTELPGGRKPIRTFVVQEADAPLMAEMFTLIRSRIDAGERAYVVCPRIDADSEKPDALPDDSESRNFDDMYDLGEDDDKQAERPPLHSVAEIAERLSALPQFAGIRFATLTGRDDDETKARVMAGFASGETPVLVATTVIEVGVDVAQASCIVIFDADRYGLSQLHQLRGRVGRGGTHSGAFLISRAEDGSDAAARLDVIKGTLDGAKIAQADLEFRGAGDVLGDAQSGGKSSLKLLRVVKDVKIIENARDDAQTLVAGDADLLDHVQLAGAVLDFTRGNETFLTSN